MKQIKLNNYDRKTYTIPPKEVSTFEDNNTIIKETKKKYTKIIGKKTNYQFKIFKKNVDIQLTQIANIFQVHKKNEKYYTGDIVIRQSIEKLINSSSTRIHKKKIVEMDETEKETEEKQKNTDTEYECYYYYINDGIDIENF